MRGGSIVDSHWAGILVRTDNHNIEVESLADTLAVPLVREVGETNVTGQLAANNILHIGGGLSNSLGVTRSHGLGISGAHWVAALHEWRLLSAAGRRRILGRDGGASRGGRGS